VAKFYREKAMVRTVGNALHIGSPERALQNDSALLTEPAQVRPMQAEQWSVQISASVRLRGGCDAVTPTAVPTAAAATTAATPAQKYQRW
jgi:hypothetical protein